MVLNKNSANIILWIILQIFMEKELTLKHC